MAELCTLDEVKTYMGISDADSQDTILESIVNSVCAKCKTYCDRLFLFNTYTEYHDGKYNRYLYPINYPVTSIIGIWDDITWSWDDDTEVDSDYYRLVDNMTVALRDILFTEGIGNIKLTYQGGYTTIPYDLKESCILQAMLTFKRKDTIDIMAQTVGEESINVLSNEAIHPAVKLVWNKYRRKSIEC